MKPASLIRTPRPAPRARNGFTLIEMLVVIAIIAILAGMVVSLAGLAAKKKILSRARAEVDNLSLAIDTYKAKKGTYPPDNPTQPYGACSNPLFYELWGAIANPGQGLFTNTLNANAAGAGLETIKSTTLTTFFGTPGIVNSAIDTNDIINFIPRLNANEIQNISTAANPVWVFAIPSPGPATGLPVVGGQPVNVIRYVSSNPTNNPTTYDLWVDVIIGGVTNRISNWKKDSEVITQ